MEPISNLSQNIHLIQGPDSKSIPNIFSVDETQTFITGMKATGALTSTSQDANNQNTNKNNQQPQQQLSSDYRQIHGELNDVIGTLDEKIDDMIIKHEKDFMAAYRGHMLKIQRELEILRKKCNEQEFLMKKDEKIVSLEKQLEWFRSEALNLSQLNKHYAKEAGSLRQKNEGLEEEKQFLLLQIQKIKRQSKILKMALGKTQDNVSQLIQFNKEGNIMLSQTPTLSIRKNHLSHLTEISVEHLLTPKEDPQQQLKPQKLKWDDQITSYDLIKIAFQQFSDDKERLAYEISRFVDDKYDDLNRKIYKIKSKNEQLEKESKKIKHIHGDNGVQQSQLQKVFIECVDTVRKEVEKRKQLQASQSPFSNTSKKTSNAGVHYDNLQSSDKMKILEIFVSKEEILTSIYEVLFAKHQSNPQQQQPIVMPDAQFFEDLDVEFQHPNINERLTPQVLSLPLPKDSSNKREPILTKYSNLYAYNHLQPPGQASIFTNYTKLITKSGGAFKQIESRLSQHGSSYTVSKHPLSTKGSSLNYIGQSSTPAAGGGSQSGLRSSSNNNIQRRPQTSSGSASNGNKTTFIGRRQRIKSSVGMNQGAIGYSNHTQRINVNDFGLQQQVMLQ